MGIKSNLTLLSNAAVSGTPQIISVGGSYIYMVSGTFGGTSTQLQVLGPDGTTFINMGAAITVAGFQKVDLPAGASVKTIITGGTPSAMHATLGLVQSSG